MAVDTYALTSLANAKQYLGIDNDDLRSSGIAIYHDTSSSATEATIQVAEDTLTLIITGGANAGTQTFALDSASYDTLSELVTGINGLNIGWVARLLGPTDVESVKLIPFPTESVFGQANEHVLDYQDDMLIEALINRVSDYIETLADRKFKSRTYREWVDSYDGNPILLKQYPVSSVKRLATGADISFYVSATTTTDLRATVEVQDDGLVLSRIDSNGSETATTLAFSSYATTSALVTQINLTTGWSATLTTNRLCLDIHRMGGHDALSRSVPITYPGTSDYEYRVEEQTGLLHILKHPLSLNGWNPSVFGPTWDRSRHRQDILVEYTAGYSTIPDDVEQLALEFIKMALDARKHDANLASGSLGDYAYSLVSGLQLTDTHRAKVMAWRNLR